MKKAKTPSHISTTHADDMTYQVNQYTNANDDQASQVQEFHNTRGKKLIPGVHKSRIASNSPFMNYVTRGKSGSM